MHTVQAKDVLEFVTVTGSASTSGRN